MKKLLLMPLTLFLLTGCVEEPTPKDDSMRAMRAKMEAIQKQRFEAKPHHTTKKKTTYKKRLDDPTAYVYKDKVLSNKEEKAWKKAGINNKEYKQWAALGMQPKEIKTWKKLGISYAAIAVFKGLKYTPAQAKEFLDQDFASRPGFYRQFGDPVYEFDEICKNVIKRQQPPFAFLEERCLPYMKASLKNEKIGHLLDLSGVKKGPLPLEYLAELRRLAEDNSKIQSGMEVTIEEFVDDEERENFIFLFPLLKSEPTEYEMQYIDNTGINLQKTERYLSYNNPEYWADKAAQKKAEEEAAARQVALLQAKKESERVALKKAQHAANLRAAKAKAVRDEKRRRLKAQEVCGPYIKPDELSGKKVLVEGKVLFTVGEKGAKMFGYGVQASDDNNIYFIRDPKNIAKVKLNSWVSWALKTMGRTESLSQSADSETEFVYNKKSKTRFEMALILDRCKL